MVGLPFPNSGADNREHSWDNGTPFSSSGDIPIDPALSEPPLDPALMEENGVLSSMQASQPPPLYPHYAPLRVQQYPQGPQGDPFAQPPPVYIPVEEPVPLPAKPLKKRKRPPAREEDCGFCNGNDANNKHGQLELMVSCVDCGRSGHPSCMGLDNMGDAMRSYEWQCATCKSCSVCRKKGNEASMLICDFCDRGWHMSCFNPPFREAPEGCWHCPCCPPVGTEHIREHDIPEESPEIQEIPPPFPAVRGSSVASSSYHIPPSSDIPDPPDHNLTTDASEVETDLTGPTPRRKPKGKQSRKGKEIARDENAEQDPLQVTPVPTIRRLRIRVNSPPLQVPENEMPTIRLRVPPRGKGKARDDAPEDFEKGLFDDILSVEDRDVRDTSIKEADVQRFERSRVIAEERLAPRPPPEPPETPIAGPSTRPLRSHATSFTPHIASSSMSPAPSAATPGPHIMFPPNGLRIRKIRFGEYDIDTWYDAPFPEEYAAIPDGRLWMCEFCLKYMKSRFSASRHQLKCKVRHPPGDEIYRDGKVSIFEVDGRKNKIYCQNLCLLSKMFLDHKSLFYDVEPFLFYVMTETDDEGAHFVGYFSKEKLSPKSYNVSCIMTLPVRQRQGWGNLLIDFSYLLSKKEQRAGSPEKPLSALGALGYRNYWTLSLMRYLQTAPPNPSLEDISTATSLTLEDIYTTLLHLNMISVLDSAQTPKPLPGQSIKFPKGRKNGIARKHLQRTNTHDEDKSKGPFVPPTRYKVRWDADQIEEYLARWEAKGYFKLRPEKLKWSPFILSRAKKTQSSGGEIANEEEMDEGNRSASADVQLSESNNGLDDVAGSAEMRALVDKTPAFTLFDDDNVEVVHAGTSRQHAPSETADAECGHTTEPAQNTRPKRNKASAMVDPPSIRRLRSRESIIESTPVRRQHTLRQETASRSERRRNPTRSRLDVTASQMDSNSNNISTPSLDDDAALAAKLAMEYPRRELRARRPSTTDQQMFVQKRLVSVPRSTSPRKRRRVDSSPEVDTTPVPRSSVLRRSSRKGESPLPRKKAVPSTPQRKSSRLNSGRSSTKSSTIALRQEEEEEEEEELPQFGLGNRAMSLSLNGDYAVEGEDSRYEDADTPVTGATAASRHSVPSDDTMIGVDTARSKVSPLPRIPEAALSPLSVLAQVADQMANAQLAGGTLPSAKPEEEEEEEDADAEGEDDLDAEGEPDYDADLT